MIRIVLVDDQTLVRQGIRSLLELASDVSIVAEASDGDEAVAVIRRENPDVVLLDLRMPGLDGLEVLERLRDLDSPPACRVLIVSASLDEETERAARAAGAAGCVSKDLARADICATALRVARQ
jgi:DNA-binding NarL/FixJ family response regulator